jgi:hypothetical protein
LLLQGRKHQQTEAGMSSSSLLNVLRLQCTDHILQERNPVEDGTPLRIKRGREYGVIRGTTRWARQRRGIRLAIRVEI